MTSFRRRISAYSVSLRQLLPSTLNFQPSTFDLTLRPEQLTIPQFVELTNLVGEALKTV